MKPQNFFAGDQGYCEYMLVANPDGKINEMLMAEKQIFYDDFKQKAAIKTKPHITVASFLAKEGMENTIIRWMQRICSKQQSFSVTLNNYGGIPPDTIYLRIQDEAPFRQLAGELGVINAYIHSGSCPPMLLTPRPHLSISGKLPEEIFFKALTQYAHKSFHESFVVNELLLLKRNHVNEASKTIIVFALQPAGEQMIN